jgi:transcriptional regulator with XRE-family HTH domain
MKGSNPMEYLKLSENILSLRHKRKVTQEELADFCSVTKASVSKWETGLSYPDIMILPKIASFFNVSIDELIGYEAQMSTEQIQKCYQTWSSDCAEKPFEQVFEQTKAVMQNYYSCYPLLLNICILWLNHYMLVPDKTKQSEILQELKKLCAHIFDKANDTWICTGAKNLQSVVDLICNEPKKVIETYEPVFDQRSFLLEANMLLIQAYEMTGNMEKAEMSSQVSIYFHLLNLVSYSTHYLYLHQNEPKLCLETIKRIEKTSEVYDLKNLHPNLWLQFIYQSTVVYASLGWNEKAKEALQTFVDRSLEFVKTGFDLHGDSYFTQISTWFEKMKVFVNAPRDKKSVLESLLPALEHPTFAAFAQDKEFILCKKKIQLALQQPL